MASVLVPLAAGCEELEAVTIIDLLRRAGVEVVSAGLASGPVKARWGTVLMPDTDLDRALARDYDMIVLPGGGPGSEALARDARVQQALQRMAAAGKYTAAICAAPMALATAGLLENRRATSYPGSLDDIPVKGMTYLEESVVQDGKVITSRGPGTAMDFALHLVEVLAGRDKRIEVEKGLVRS
jgi:4-methyl-5(b-hydroxyethyl)-thiazole monophosphate biosynthesis